MTVLAVSLVASAGGCKKKKKEEGLTPEEATKVAQMKPVVEQRLAQIASLAPKAKARLTVSTDQPITEKLPPGSYVLVGDEYLADPNATGLELDLSDARVWLCKRIVERAEVQRDDLAHLEGCTRIEYAAVIRKTSFTRPKVGDAVYTAGEFRGDMLVFHLATGELRGSYHLSAKNDEQINTKGKVEKHEVEEIAVKELVTNVKEAAVEKLK